MRAAVVSVIGVWVCASGCGGKTLDLGHDTNEGPGYATPDTIAREVDAAPGTPTVIASHQYGAFNIAVDDTRVYWTTSGSPPPGRPDLAKESCLVRSCMKDNCADTVVTYASGGAMPGALRVNRTYVYWHSSTDLLGPQQILACPLDGCIGAPTTIVESGAGAFAVDDAHIYWQSGGATLMQCSFDGCAGAPTMMTFQSGRGSALELDATDIFWIEGASTASGAIMALPKDKSAPARTFVSKLRGPYSLTVDSGSVYWVEPDAQGSEVTLKRCPTTGCSGDPSIVASQQQYARSLHVQGDYADWFTADLPPLYPSNAVGTLRQCPITGCGAEPRIVADDQRSIVWTAIDATHVYWTISDQRPDYIDGAVRRIRRRP
ncbi:MAG TPA: hypothetical protein VK550_27250 [Polyangiaceae bacterium]|nr:hypothetical protein [Polyangiaceae bacterium]